MAFLQGNCGLICKFLGGFSHYKSYVVISHMCFMQSILTHFRLNEPPSNFNFRYVRLCDLDIPREKWPNYANSGGPGKMLHSASCGQTLHCLPILWLSRLKWV